jgi:NAD(P)-dependent dehydrogenase (short-subunit alcohol dehydrogenase family)
MQSVLHKVVGPTEVHPENLDGRVAIVTGGALGIGYFLSYPFTATMANIAQLRSQPGFSPRWRQSHHGQPQRRARRRCDLNHQE